MSYYESDILIENIRTLMQNNRITQQQLAEELGMSQANVSKALNINDKKSFTLDQIVGIAKYFNTSIDDLIGYQNSPETKLTPRKIGSFITSLIESENAVFAEVERKERVFWVDYNTPDEDGWGFDSGNEDRTNTYLAIVLPSYWQIPNDIPREKMIELYSEISQIGNETAMLSVNKFLHDFRQIHDIYKKGSLEESTYRTVVDNLLANLRD